MGDVKFNMERLQGGAKVVGCAKLIPIGVL